MRDQKTTSQDARQTAKRDPARGRYQTGTYRPLAGMLWRLAASRFSGPRSDTRPWNSVAPGRSLAYIPIATTTSEARRG